MGTTMKIQFQVEGSNGEGAVEIDAIQREVDSATLVFRDNHIQLTPSAVAAVNRAFLGDLDGFHAIFAAAEKKAGYEHTSGGCSLSVFV